MIKTTIDKQFFDKWKNEDVVMHCPTEEYAILFCRLMNENGKTWFDGTSYLSKTYWEAHKKTTCYHFNEGDYGGYYKFKSKKYIILEFEDFIIPEEEPETINHQWFNYWKDKKVVMSCRHKKDAEAFCEILYEHGLSWFNGDSYLKTTDWTNNKGNSCYDFNRGFVLNLNSCRPLGFTVLYFKDYAKKMKPKEKIKTMIDEKFFEYWRGKDVVMHCSTNEYAKEFCKIMHEHGLTWGSGGSYLERTNWYLFEENTCYNFNEGLSGSVHYRKESPKVLEFEDYIIEEMERKPVTEVKPPMLINLTESFLYDLNTLLTEHIQENFSLNLEKAEDYQIFHENFKIEMLVLLGEEEYAFKIYDKRTGEVRREYRFEF